MNDCLRFFKGKRFIGPLRIEFLARSRNPEDDLHRICLAVQEESALERLDHAVGGFVLTMLYNSARSTADVDVITVVPGAVEQHLLTLAGKGSDDDLHSQRDIASGAFEK